MSVPLKIFKVQQKKISNDERGITNNGLTIETHKSFSLFLGLIFTDLVEQMISEYNSIRQSTEQGAVSVPIVNVLNNTKRNYSFK